MVIKHTKDCTAARGRVLHTGHICQGREVRTELAKPCCHCPTARGLAPSGGTLYVTLYVTSRPGVRRRPAEMTLAPADVPLVGPVSAAALILSPCDIAAGVAGVTSCGDCSEATRHVISQQACRVGPLDVLARVAAE